MSTNPAGGPSARLAAALRERAREIAQRWHDILEERLDIAPGRVFPTPEELDHIPQVVAWILAEGPDREELTPEIVDPLRELVALRREQIHFPEQLLLEMEFLSEIVFDVLRDEILALEPSEERSPELILDAGRALSRGLHRVSVALTVLYWEKREEEREAHLEEIGEFTRMLSHELRDPLGAALTAARLLGDVGEELPEAARRRVLASVPRNIARATDLLESVRRLVVTRGRGDPDRARPIRAVVEEVVDELSEPARDAGVEIEVVGPVPPVDVDGDRVQLILHNLVGNAVKYADPEKEGRWVRIRFEQEDRNGEALDTGYRIEVRDNGIGIPEEERERIFQRFYRARREGRKGSGLGLAIARKAARQMGSAIDVKSGTGEGSMFSFTVHAAEEPSSEGGGGRG